MTLGQAISTCLGKYATFNGRASRSEYWWFILFGVLINWGATLIGGDRAGGLVNVALLLPQLAVGARRLHDIGKSGWWQLLYLTIIGIVVLLYWQIRRGDSFDNEHGEDPLAVPPVPGA